MAELAEAKRFPTRSGKLNWWRETMDTAVADQLKRIEGINQRFGVGTRSGSKPAMSKRKDNLLKPWQKMRLQQWRWLACGAALFGLSRLFSPHLVRMPFWVRRMQAIVNVALQIHVSYRGHAAISALCSALPARHLFRDG
jgi:hypothetical protein